MGWGPVLSPRGLAEAAWREGWRATHAIGRVALVWGQGWEGESKQDLLI